MKILVTGGAGYIGSQTVRCILERGWTPIILDNLSNSNLDNLKAVFSGRYQDMLISTTDARDLERLRAVFKLNSFDAVIHFAAFKSVPESLVIPLAYHDNNVVSLINVLKCIQEYEVPNFIFSSSCAVYGEGDGLPLTEDTPFGIAQSPYARTKQICEHIIQDAYSNEKDNKKAIILRYFNPAGADFDNMIGDRIKTYPDSLVSRLVQFADGNLKDFCIYGNDYPTRDGTCIRDFIHIRDLAEAHVKALMYIREQRMPVEVYNVATGKGTTVQELINAFEESFFKLNVKIGPRRPGDIMSAFSDNTKIEKDLCWKSKYTITEIVKTAWHWSQKNKKK